MKITFEEYAELHAKYLHDAEMTENQAKFKAYDDMCHKYGKENVDKMLEHELNTW